MKNIKQETIIRTIILFLAIINNALALFGKSPLPIDNETVSMVVSFIFTTGASLWTWWKNNSFTENAIKADDYLKELKQKKVNKHEGD